MRNLSKKSKIIILSVAAGAVILAMPFVIYLKALPYAVSNPKVIHFVQDVLKEQAGLELNIKSPVLKTALTPDISFKVEEMSLYKDKQPVLAVQNFDTSLSFAKIFKHTIIVKKLGADDIYADVNKLTSLVSQDEKKRTETVRLVF